MKAVMTIFPYAVATVAAIACLCLFLIPMSSGVVVSIMTASILLLVFAFCYLERKHQRELQRLREALDRLRSKRQSDH